MRAISVAKHLWVCADVRKAFVHVPRARYLAQSQVLGGDDMCISCTNEQIRKTGRYLVNANGLCFINAPSLSSSALWLSSRTQATAMAPVASGSSFSAHSHTTSTRHAALERVRIALMSRALFAESLASQKSDLVAGSRNSGHPSWRCQKQPCTKTAARHFGRTTSGRPGNALACKRKRNPACQNACLIRSSGPVFLPRIFDMVSERCSALITSAISPVSGS